MATCKDCIHYDLCLEIGDEAAKELPEGAEKECKCFKNKDDFVEVKHGIWTLARSGRKVVCSCCETPAPFKKKETYHALWSSEYCPHCGAKMDGGKNNASVL